MLQEDVQDTSLGSFKGMKQSQRNLKLSLIPRSYGSRLPQILPRTISSWIIKMKREHRNDQPHQCSTMSSHS